MSGEKIILPKYKIVEEDEKHLEKYYRNPPKTLEEIRCELLNVRWMEDKEMALIEQEKWFLEVLKEIRKRPESMNYYIDTMEKHLKSYTEMTMERLHEKEKILETLLERRKKNERGVD